MSRTEKLQPPTTDDPQAWEIFLASEGLGSKLPKIFSGKRERFGDGLGVKTEQEERLEDAGGHSSMCPIILRPLDSNIDRPGDRPVEDAVEESAP